MAAHDESYRLLFSHARMVEDLLRGFVREAWVEELDFSTLERVPGRLVSDRLRRREADLLWKVRWRGGSWLYVYLLLEFQSTADPWMAVRLLGYVALLYQDLIRRRELGPGGKLPPVLPLVLYNGRGAWRPPRELARLIAPAPPGLRRYQPRLRYLLVDEGRLRRPELSRPDNLAAVLFRLERLRLPEATEVGVGDLERWLAGPELEPLRRAFGAWIQQVLLVGGPAGADVPVVGDFQEAKAMLAERIKEWTREALEKGLHKGRQEGRKQGRQEGRKQGRQQGRQQGEAELLLRQLERRFGSLTSEVRRRIAAADSAQILVWGDRVLTAASIDEVLAD
jgi:predicted transposase YdaD